MLHRSLALATTLGLMVGMAVVPGCVPGMRAPTPEALRYEAPTTEAVVYDFADTARFTVEAGPVGDMRVTTSNTGLARVQLDPLDSGVMATVDFPRLLSSYETTSGGVRRGTQDDLGGPVRVRLGPAGDLAVTSAPRFEPALAAIAGAESLVRPLFVRLSNRAVRTGDRWIDTVTTAERSDSATTRVTSRITTTLVGDTIMDGVRLLVLRTESETEMETIDTSGGVPIVQQVEGLISGIVLWDPERSILVLREEEGRLLGTLRLADVDREPLPVTAQVTRRVELRR